MKLDRASGVWQDCAMPPLLACPNCGQSINLVLGHCRGCGMLFTTTDDSIDEAALIGLLHNVRIRLSGLAPHKFQQVLGIVGPRIGRHADDGIPFTESTCRRTYQYLTDHGILCRCIAITENNITTWSLVMAISVIGIDRCLRLARKTAWRRRSRLEII